MDVRRRGGWTLTGHPNQKSDRQGRVGRRVRERVLTDLIAEISSDQAHGWLTASHDSALSASLGIDV